MMNNDRRLTRSSSDRMIGGVAAGFAEYFGMDPALMRVIFGLLLITGIGLPLYVICWIVIPRSHSELIILSDDPPRRSIFRTVLQIVALLIVVAILNDQVGAESAMVAFVIGLGIGAFFLLRNRDGRSEGLDGGLYRLDEGRKFLGVFAGLSQILGVDVTLLRIIGVVLVIAGLPVTIALYLLYALIVPVRRALVI